MRRGASRACNARIWLTSERAWRRLAIEGVTCLVLSFSARYSLAQSCGQQLPGILAGPVVNTNNQHRYYLLQPSCWTDAEATAVSMGGHLVTLNDATEHDWVMHTFSVFGGVDHDLWIGFYAPHPVVNTTNYPAWTGQFVWTSGQSSKAIYLRWAQEGMVVGTDGLYVSMLPPDKSVWFPGEWVAVESSNLMNGVVEVPLPLEIASQPQDVSVGVGGSTSLSVVADGTTALTYQWQFMGTNLDGATSSRLWFTNAQPFQSGTYQVIVSNSAGVLHSRSATLAVSGIVAWGGAGPGISMVPAYVINVVATAGGLLHALGLRDDGKVVAWGDNQIGQTDVPAGLTPVRAIGAGSYFSVAVRTDGTVAAWGQNDKGQTDFPGDLTNAIAVSCRSDHSLALKSDGTAMAWPPGQDPPPGLEGVVSVAAGTSHSLVLRADGSVVTWGDNFWGQQNVPSDLTDVVAIAAGTRHSLALQADGTVRAWGANESGQASVPVGLSNVVAIAAGDIHSLALKADGSVVAWGLGSGVYPANQPNVVGIGAGDYSCLALVGDGSPHIALPPYDQFVGVGVRVRFTAKAVGATPMAFQWQFNGEDIPGATKDAYVVPHADFRNTGTYRVSISNRLGSVTSRAATLQVSTPINHPPRLASLPDRTINANTHLTVVNAAIDLDIPTNVLSYQFFEAPFGATIDNQGVIRWTPTPDDVPGTRVFTTVVTDNGVPPLRATNRFAVAVLDWAHTGPAGILAGPIVNPANNHQYFLLDPNTWTDSENTAQAMGGHLVTINDQNEHFWVLGTFSNFGRVGRALWIGLSDSWASPQGYVWSSGQPLTFFCWSTDPAITSQGTGRIKMAQPNPAYHWDQCEWAEEADSTPLNAVVEIPYSLEIVAQPRSVSIGIGGDTTLSVVADATSALTYQWQFMGTNLPGATQSSLRLINAQPAQSGPYRVVVSSADGTLLSAAALVSVQGIVGWGLSAYDVFNMPATLLDVMSIASGAFHSLAVLADGTVVGWGDNSVGQLNIPTGLSNVVAVAGGYSHSLALTSSGQVVGWGADSAGQVDIPADLSNAVAIAAGEAFSMALKSDGSLISWGNMPQNGPAQAGLTNVVAIAAGDTYGLALKADGTLATWGDYIWNSNEGWVHAFVPPDLSNVVAIAAGASHSLAIRADGSVTAWGFSSYGDTQVPSGLTNVVAIRAGDRHSLALTRDGRVVNWGHVVPDVRQPTNLLNVVAISAGRNFSLALLRDGAPHITVQPWDLAVGNGSQATFIGRAVGVQSMDYQWRFNGANIVGATSDSLAITNAQPAAAGLYSLVAANRLGITVSRQALLTINLGPIDTDEDGMADDWEVAHGLNPKDPADALLSPTADGLPNLLRYALGIEATNGPGPLSGAIEPGENGNGYASIIFKRRRLTAGLQYVPEVSADLHTWYSGADHLKVIRTIVVDNEFDLVTAQDLAPVTVGAPRFLRLRVVK